MISLPSLDTRPITSLAVLEALHSGQAMSLPELHRLSAIPQKNLSESAQLLERYGVIQRCGPRLGSYQMKSLPTFDPPSPTAQPDPLLYQNVLAGIDTHRTAYKLSQSLKQPRERVEYVLETALKQQLIERIFIGHLAIYHRTTLPDLN